MRDGASDGKAARGTAPRRSHGDWAPPRRRADPVDVLERQAATRLHELNPIRYGRMLVSPFAFFRGAAAIMAADLADTPQTGFRAQLCGDAHLANFGVFGTPERRLAFDLNDFDETLAGPWEWDVKRLAVSIAVAGRERGLSRKQRAKVVRAAAASYRTAMREFAGMTALDVWYAHVDAERLLAERRSELDPKLAARAGGNLEKARTRDNLRAFSKLTHMVDGEPRIVSEPPLIVPVEELAPGVAWRDVDAWLRAMFDEYAESLAPERRRLLAQYRLVHFARRVVGVGSVGRRTWIALFLGSDRGDPLFLQVKEAEASVLAPFAGEDGCANQAERVVRGQRLMQAASDTFLGFKPTRADADGGPRDFYVRQLHDWKGSADLERMSPRGFVAYGQVCGWTLARAHARSGDRVAIAAYLGSGTAFDEGMERFAEAYADQNERDFAALAAAGADGRVAVEEGV